MQCRTTEYCTSIGYCRLSTKPKTKATTKAPVEAPGNDEEASKTLPNCISKTGVTSAKGSSIKPKDNSTKKSSAESANKTTSTKHSSELENSFVESEKTTAVNQNIDKTTSTKHPSELENSFVEPENSILQ